MKYFDTELALTALTASTDWTGTEFDPTTFNTLFVPVVGAGINQRIGKGAKVYKIKIRGSIVCASQVDQTSADSGTQIRLLLVQDKQTNATQAQGEQVMTDPTAASAAVAVNSFQNIDNFGRFRVLKDKTIILDNSNLSWDGTNMEQAGQVRTFKINIRFKVPVSVRFNATNGGTVADIVDNSFHIIANASSTGLAPNITYQSRVCFKE